MTVQAGFHPKSRLHVSVTFRFNAFRPSGYGQNLSTPIRVICTCGWTYRIQRPFAAAKCSRFKGIPTPQQRPSHRENHSRQQNGYRN